jgi:hypothetical protein
MGGSGGLVVSRTASVVLPRLTCGGGAELKTYLTLSASAAVSAHPAPPRHGRTHIRSRQTTLDVRLPTCERAHRVGRVCWTTSSINTHVLAFVPRGSCATPCWCSCLACTELGSGRPVRAHGERPRARRTVPPHPAPSLRGATRHASRGLEVQLPRTRRSRPAFPSRCTASSARGGGVPWPRRSTACRASKPS